MPVTKTMTAGFVLLTVGLVAIIVAIFLPFFHIVFATSPETPVDVKITSHIRSDGSEWLKYTHDDCKVLDVYLDQVSSTDAIYWDLSFFQSIVCTYSPILLGITAGGVAFCGLGVLGIAFTLVTGAKATQAILFRNSVLFGVVPIGLGGMILWAGWVMALVSGFTGIMQNPIREDDDPKIHCRPMFGYYVQSAGSFLMLVGFGMYLISLVASNRVNKRAAQAGTTAVGTPYNALG